MPKKKSALLPNNGSTYETFLRSVKLYSLALDEMSAKIDRDKYWSPLKKDDSLVREIGSVFKALNVKDDHFDVEAKFELAISLKSNKFEILTITCTYSAHFHAAPDLNAEAAKQFAKSEAKIIVWPYFRNFVSDMTGRMHIPPITIPLALG